MTRVKVSEHRGTLCSLRITRRNLVPERKFDVIVRALDNPTLALDALQ